MHFYRRPVGTLKLFRSGHTVHIIKQHQFQVLIVNIFKNTKGNMNRICQILLRPSYASNLTATARATMPLLVTAPRCWYSADAAAPPAALDKPTLDKLVRTNKVVVFMKGNPQAPRCGFSNAVVQIMRMHGVQYDAHDVLQNEALRQGKLTGLHSYSSRDVRI